MSVSTTQRQWRIGEVARASGLTVRTLHHYDEIRLLVPSNRSEAGYRLYGDADVERLYRILALRAMGFSLDEIAAALARQGADLSGPVRVYSEAEKRAWEAANPAAPVAPARRGQAYRRRGRQRPS